MKLQLSRDGGTVEIKQIDLKQQTLYFGEHVEGSVSFLAYSNEGKHHIDLLANRNFGLIFDHLKSLYPTAFIDKCWLSTQLVGCVFSIKKTALFICSECDSILGLTDQINEDGVQKTFIMPCEKCLEDERSAAFEEGIADHREGREWVNERDFF